MSVICASMKGEADATLRYRKISLVLWLTSDLEQLRDLSLPPPPAANNITPTLLARWPEYTQLIFTITSTFSVSFLWVKTHQVCIQALYMC